MPDVYAERKPMNAFLRLLLMIILYVLFIVVRTLILLLAAFQFFAHLFTGKPTQRGARWGAALSNWTHRMLLFMTYNSERMPFPFHAIGSDRD